MKTTIFILSCFGIFVVAKSERVSKAVYRWHVDTGGVDIGERPFRLALMTAGVLLTFLSFLIPFIPDE